MKTRDSCFHTNLHGAFGKLEMMQKCHFQTRTSRDRGSGFGEGSLRKQSLGLCNIALGLYI
jgi:hypothetical protein